MAVTKITQERVEEMMQKLAALPPPPRPSLTKQEVVTQLAPMIRDMQTKHYQLEDILPVLNERGEGFTAASLKTYLTRASKPPTETLEPSAEAGQDKKSAKAVSKDSAKPRAVKAKPAPDQEGVVSDQHVGTANQEPGSALRAPLPSGDVL